MFAGAENDSPLGAVFSFAIVSAELLSPSPASAISKVSSEDVVFEDIQIYENCKVIEP